MYYLGPSPPHTSPFGCPSFIGLATSGGAFALPVVILLALKRTSPHDSLMRCREVPTKFPFTGVLPFSADASSRTRNVGVTSPTVLKCNQKCKRRRASRPTMSTILPQTSIDPCAQRWSIFQFRLKILKLLIILYKGSRRNSIFRPPSQQQKSTYEHPKVPIHPPSTNVQPSQGRDG